MDWIVEKPEDYPELLPDIFSAFGNSPIWCFYGELGAGKTTLIQHICTFMEVDGDVVSPSFSIINEYESAHDGPVYHFDFYRLDHAMEAIDLGVPDYFDSGQRCLIEWPDRIAPFIPDDHVKFTFNVMEGTKRQLTVAHHGGRA